MNQDAATADPKTREFLMAVVKILLDFISAVNNRENKVSVRNMPNQKF